LKEANIKYIQNSQKADNNFIERYWLV
jgi:hypothetical protein